MLKKFLNGPIRKVIMVKLKFEDLRFFTTRPTRLGHLENFSKKNFFEKKNFLLKKFRKFTMVKVKLEDLQINFPVVCHPSSTLRKI